MSSRNQKVVNLFQNTLNDADYHLLERLAALSTKIDELVGAIVARGFLTNKERKALDLFMEFNSTDKRGKTRTDRNKSPAVFNRNLRQAPDFTRAASRG